MCDEMEGSADDAPEHIVPCTAGENKTCQIVEKLSTWNELLLGSQFELLEMQTAGQLFLNSTGNFPMIDNFYALRIPQYPELIGWLLRTHRCIASVYLKLSAAGNKSFSVLDALRHSTGTKKVILWFEDMQLFDAAFKVIPCLTKIEELHCGIHYDAALEGFIDALSALLQASSSLTRLTLSCLRLVGPVAETLFTHLLLNKHKLKKLDLDDCELICESYPYALNEYLGTTTALNHFAVQRTNEVVQKAILEGILKNRSIETLLIGRFIENEESRRIVAAVIRENRVIRNLSISFTADPAIWPPSAYGCWLPPLTQNDTLEEVSFPLKMFCVSEWATFIRALPFKENLKKVHIDVGFDHLQLLPVYAEIESNGLQEKVSITFKGFARDTDLLHCKAISNMELSAGEPDDCLVAALHLLPNFQHVTDLCIELRSGSMTLSLALAEYLISTTTLHNLELNVGWDLVVQPKGPSPWWSVIHESLSRNKSLRKLRVSVYLFSAQDTEGLADAVKRSQSITWVEFIEGPKCNASVFVRRLSKGFADNWTLQFVLCGFFIDADAARDWFAVCETTRRNSDLVTRAARLMMTSDVDRYVIGALERVSRYPALLNEVAEKAHIDKSEIGGLVRDRLKTAETMDGFMRVVGVVRERVVCHPPDEDRMQLDDLIEDCWRHVRRYLVIADVKHGIKHGAVSAVSQSLTLS